MRPNPKSFTWNFYPRERASREAAPGRGGTPYEGLTGRLRPKGVPFSGFGYMER